MLQCQHFVKHTTEHDIDVLSIDQGNELMQRICLHTGIMLAKLRLPQDYDALPNYASTLYLRQSESDETSSFRVSDKR